MSLLHAAPAESEVVPALKQAFFEAYGIEPDAIYSAPGRVNIIGEHVDYQNGLCLPMAISHRCYVAVKKTDGNQLRVRSLQSEEVAEISAIGLEPGKLQGWATYVLGVLWALEDFFADGVNRGMDIMVDGYVPLGAGLSSSAALECAVAEALEDQFELGTSAHERIKACIKAENEFAGANTGGLDQSASILSQAGFALELDCVDFSTRLVPWDLAGEGLSLLICDTRAPHSLVGGEYAERRAQAEAAAKACGVETLRDLDPQGAEAKLAEITDPVVQKRGRHIVQEIKRVQDFVAWLDSGNGQKGTVRENLEQLGTLLNASHDSLRDDYEVTVGELDTAVEAARKAGAYGARMTGGGFGGSIIALVEADAVEAVAQAIVEAFAAKEYREPVFFLATPSAGARKE